MEIGNETIDDLAKLASARAKESSATAFLKSLKEAFEKTEEYIKYKSEQDEARKASTSLTDKIKSYWREMLNSNKAKKEDLPDGVNCKNVTNFTVTDSAALLQWVKLEMKAALIESVDLKTVETYAKACAAEKKTVPPGVTVEEVKDVTLASDLSKYIEVK